MPIYKFAKVLVLAPAIGSALIGIVGLLLFGGVLIAGRGQAGNRMLRYTGQDPASIKLLLQGLPARSAPKTTVAHGKTQPMANELLHSNTPQQRAGNAMGKQMNTALNFSLFRRSISRGQLAFLKDYAGRTPDDAEGKQKVRTLIGMTSPYAPFHLGVDMPLSEALDFFLLRHPQPIAIRAGRYATISGIRGRNARGRGLLWVDMREGIALGAIFFYPSNGEPSPTLTIFSDQLDRRSVRMSQLPRAFATDLSRWAATEGVPPITTRYFIGASGEKFVLAHDEDYCKRAASLPAPFPKDVCEAMNVQAAGIDRKAGRFLQQTHNASNATMHMLASTTKVE